MAGFRHNAFQISNQGLIRQYRSAKAVIEESHDLVADVVVGGIFEDFSAGAEK
jgi:hypothetical protein